MAMSAGTHQSAKIGERARHQRAAEQHARGGRNQADRAGSRGEPVELPTGGTASAQQRETRPNVVRRAAGCTATATATPSAASDPTTMDNTASTA